MEISGEQDYSLNDCFCMGISNRNLLDRIFFSLWVLLFPLAILEYLLRGKTESWDKYSYRIRRKIYLLKKKRIMEE